MTTEQRQSVTALIKEFREGRLPADGLARALSARAADLSAPTDGAVRTLMEQIGIRIEAVLLGVCEAEQEAHVSDLLRELESKLLLVEP